MSDATLRALGRLAQRSDDPNDAALATHARHRAGQCGGPESCDPCVMTAAVAMLGTVTDWTPVRSFGRSVQVGDVVLSGTGPAAVPALVVGTRGPGLGRNGRPAIGASGRVCVTADGSVRTCSSYVRVAVAPRTAEPAKGSALVAVRVPVPASWRALGCALRAERRAALAAAQRSDALVGPGRRR